MNSTSQQRFKELQARFIELEDKLPDNIEKEALSILHAMVQESLRVGQVPRSENSVAQTSGTTLDDIANLYKDAPPMGGDAENSGLPVDTEAPDFALRDANGNTVRLSDYRGKNVVLVFYPLDWSPGCSDQLSLYQNDIKEFEKANVQLIGISVDSIYSHGAWTAVRGLTFPLLSDFQPKGEVARKYGVMRDSDGFSERALYIVDTNGYIRYKEVSPQLDHIPDIYKLLDRLKNLEPSATGAAGQ